MMGVMDGHVHLEDIKVLDPTVATYFKIQPGEARWKAEIMEVVAEYIKRDRIEQLVAIYEDPDLVERLRILSPDCDVLGFYFVRDVVDLNEERLRVLKVRGLLQGLKIHPVNDNFELKTENIAPVLAVARKYQLPILYHSDDRAEFWHLTHPNLQRQLVRENQDVVFIVGHGGAYANPRLVGDSPQVRGYWEGTDSSPSRRYLVESALGLAYDFDNVFFDTSVVYNRIKSEIVVRKVAENDGLELKILLGSDYPIKHASTQGQLTALEKAGMRSETLERIARNRIIRRE